MLSAIKANLKYIFIGLLAYLIFLVVNLPASFVYSYWKKSAGEQVPVSLQDISGTIWNGQVGHAVIRGQSIEELNWNIQSLTMLLGILESDFEIKVKDGYTKGTAGYSFFGGAYLNNIEGWLPLSEIADLVNIGAMSPGGDLDIKVEKIKLDDSTIVSAQGDIAWHSAELTLLKKLVLGDLKITLEPDGDKVKAILVDQGGPLKADGTLMLNPDKSYEFKAAFGVRGSQPDLSNALGTLGRVDKDGKIKVSQKGNLSQLGF